MSGSSGNQSQQTGPPAWAQPAAGLGLLGAESLLFPGMFPNAPKLPQMPSNLNQQVAPFSPYQQQALGQIAGLTGPASGLAGAGAGNLFQTLSGQFLNPASNPYLQATYQEAAQPMIQDYQLAIAPSRMAAGETAAGGGPGALQGSGNQQMVALDQYGLGQNLGNLATNIFGNAYQQERQNQLAGLQLLPSTLGGLFMPAQELFAAGGTQQAQQQSVLDTLFRNALRANQYPWQQLGNFANLFGGLTGGSSSTTISGSK